MSYGDVFLDGVIRLNSYNNRLVGQNIFSRRLMEHYRYEDRIKLESEIKCAKQEVTKSFEKNLEWYKNLIKEDKNG